MHYVHRILPLPHMQARKSTPSAADGIERPPGALEGLSPRELLTDNLGGLFRRSLRKVHQRRPPSGRLTPGLALLVRESREARVSRRPIPDKAIRFVIRSYDAKGRQSCFPLAAQQLDFTIEQVFRAIS